MNTVTQTLDAGTNNVVTIDPTAPDARSMMLTSAAAIASTIVATEGTLAESAKAWGQSLFRAVYVDGLNMDSLIGDSKVAAGWGAIAKSEAGKKAKGRLEVYFSNARLVAERWGAMEQAKRDEVLAGLSSIHYLAGQFRKADSDAKKAEKQAAKLAEAQSDAQDSAQDVATPSAPAFDPFAAMAQLAAYFAEMNVDQAQDVSSHVKAMMEAYDNRINALIDAGDAEPVAVAA